MEDYMKFVGMKFRRHGRICMVVAVRAEGEFPVTIEVRDEDMFYKADVRLDFIDDLVRKDAFIG